jgi:hypothetical protein
MLLQAHMPAVAVPAMYWRRTFPGRPDQARAVRAFVAALLPDRPCLDEVLLAVDELVVNALRHTKSGQGGRFSVHVRDAAGRTADGFRRLTSSLGGSGTESAPGARFRGSARATAWPRDDIGGAMAALGRGAMVLPGTGIELDKVDLRGTDLAEADITGAIVMNIASCHASDRLWPG